MSKFARMTSNLLVRKGDAEPSLLAQQDKHALFWSQLRSQSAGDGPVEMRPDLRRDPEPVATPTVLPKPPFPPPNLRLAKAQVVAEEERKLAEHHPERHRKISLALSDHEHEALGIAAVKLGVTRNHLLRDALDALLESLERQYGGKCKCIADGMMKDECCQSGKTSGNSN